MGVLSANVRRLRDDRGLSQTALAEAAGLSRSTIAALEKEGGKYSSADMSTIQALAKAFEVSVLDLLKPNFESMPSHPLVEAFLGSEWPKTLQPTLEELAWLRSLPDTVWVGARPSADTVARMLMWRRDTAARNDS